MLSSDVGGRADSFRSYPAAATMLAQLAACALAPPDEVLAMRLAQVNPVEHAEVACRQARGLMNANSL